MSNMLFNAVVTKTIKEPEPDHPVLDADGNYSYEFKIPIGYVGTYAFEISNITSTATYKLVHESGTIIKTYTSKSTMSGEVEIFPNEYYKMTIINKNNSDDFSFSYNSSMTLSGKGEKYVSELDDTSTNAMEYNAVIGGEPFENWVGPGDLTDWVKLNNFTEGSRTLQCKLISGNRATFALYTKKVGSTSSPSVDSSWNLTSTTNKTIKFSSDKECFIKIYASSSSVSNSTIYNALYTIQVTA